MSLTASIIPDWVREMVVEAWNWHCALDGCSERADGVHHIKENSVANVKRWPLFINSPFNLRPLSNSCHNGVRMHELKITDKVADMYEAFLQRITNG